MKKKKDRDCLPINKSRNGSGIRTFEFEESDASMLASALSVAAVTEMMCGGESSVGRLRYYTQEMRKHVPEGASLFNRPTDLCEIAICSTAVPSWTHYRIRSNSWTKRFRAVFVVGTRKFASSGLLESEDDFTKMINIVKGLVNLNCQYVESSDVVGNVWSI